MQIASMTKFSGIIVKKNYPMQGSKLKIASGRLLATNGRNIVARCKFLVASLYNVNDAAHSMARSIRFDCLKISWTEVGINFDVNSFVYAIWHVFYDESKAR